MSNDNEGDQSHLPHCSPSDDVKRASSIVADICEHGTLHVSLLDDQGKAFASAALGIERALEFYQGIGERLEYWMNSVASTSKLDS